MRWDQIFVTIGVIAKGSGGMLHREFYIYSFSEHFYFHSIQV